MIAALSARGRSIIDRAELIDRGYENVAERLNKLGAQIQREE
jgi:UDP-N-acetylglucosamine 1-carboxyvinyltransferase